MYSGDKLQMEDKRGDVNTNLFWVTLNRLQDGGHRWPKMGLSPHQSPPALEYAHFAVSPL